MGSIYKQKKSKNWWVKYYRNGKPYRESSHSTKESKAKRLLKLREGQIVYLFKSCRFLCSVSIENHEQYIEY